MACRIVVGGRQLSAEAVVIDPARLMQPKRDLPELDALLHRCLSTRGSLKLQLRQCEAVISAELSKVPRTAVALAGRWRSPTLEEADLSASVRLLAPFLVRIDGIDLPHHQIYTLGRDGRTVADFFMRNIFYAACRRTPFAPLLRRANDASTVPPASRDLMRTYGWIAKATLKDSVFQRADASELILAEAHAPLGIFESPLLQAGAAALRTHGARRAALSQTRCSVAAAMRLRDEALALYK